MGLSCVFSSFFGFVFNKSYDIGVLYSNILFIMIGLIELAYALLFLWLDNTKLSKEYELKVNLCLVGIKFLGVILIIIIYCLLMNYKVPIVSFIIIIVTYLMCVKGILKLVFI